MKINGEKTKIEGIKISTFCLKGIRLTAIVLIGYLFLQGLYTICCIQRVTEKTYFMKNNVFTQLLGIVLFGIVIRLLLGKRVQHFLERHGSKVFTVAFLLMIIFWGFWISQTRFWCLGDMEKVCQYAEMLLNGDYSGWQPGGYPYMWPHQNGLLLFVALMLKFMDLNTTFLALYILNIVFYGITILSLYISWRILSHEKGISCIQGLLLIGYFPYGFFCTLLYGNVIGFGWACVAIVLFLRYRQNGRARSAVASAVCMVFAIVFKQNEMIIFVGIVVVMLFDWLVRKRERKKGAVCAILFVLITLVGIQFPNVLLGQIIGFPIEGGNSRFAHLAMGLQTEMGGSAPGWYNGYNEEVFMENGYDRGLTAQASLESIKNSWKGFLDEPLEGWRFFHQKFAAEWNNPSFECFNIQNSRNTALELSSAVKSVINDGGKLNILLIYLSDILQSAILFGVLIYLICARQADWGTLLFALLFIGGFVFFALWETKCQYVLPFFFMLIPYSVLGYRELWQGGLLKLRIQKVPREGGKSGSGTLHIQGWNRVHTTLAVIILLIVVVGLSDNVWICDSLKLNRDTEAYYEYIHQYNHNFMNLRF